MLKLNKYDDWIQLQPIALAIKINVLFKDTHHVESCHKSNCEEREIYVKWSELYICVMNTGVDRLCLGKLADGRRLTFTCSSGLFSSSYCIFEMIKLRLATKILKEKKNSSKYLIPGTTGIASLFTDYSSLKTLETEQENCWILPSSDVYLKHSEDSNLAFKHALWRQA